MPTIDALTQAKYNLERTDAIIDDTENCDPLVSAQAGQLAVLIVLAEQAKRIADALNSIDIVLTNASGADGVIKVEAWTYDARRELG